MCRAQPVPGTAASEECERPSHLIFEDEVLGSGCSGDVRLARRNGDLVAVKAVPLHWPEARNEARLLEQQRHPHIVELLESHDGASSMRLVMEALLGGDLFSHVSELGSLSEEKAAETMRQVLSPVAHLHSRGVAHRDLKLDNFVYSDRSRSCLKLIDFGAACEFRGSAAMSEVVGSLDYVAPEVLRGSYTESADVWSLGIVAFMLLCGRSPWIGEDDRVRAAILAGKPRFRIPEFQRLSAKAKDFVRSLLTVNPAARPTAEEALKHPFLGGRRSSWESLGSVLLSMVSPRGAPAIELGKTTPFRSPSLSSQSTSPSLTDNEREEALVSYPFFALLARGAPPVVFLGRRPSLAGSAGLDQA